MNGVLFGGNGDVQNYGTVTGWNVKGNCEIHNLSYFPKDIKSTFEVPEFFMAM